MGELIAQARLLISQRIEMLMDFADRPSVQPEIIALTRLRADPLNQELLNAAYHAMQDRQDLEELDREYPKGYLIG